MRQQTSRLCGRVVRVGCFFDGVDVSKEFGIDIMEVTMCGSNESEKESDDSHYPGDNSCGDGVAVDLLGGIGELHLNLDKSIVGRDHDAIGGSGVSTTSG